MAVTAGALSRVLIGQTTASVLSAAATAGTGPYTYQWYRSTTTGFTPGAGNIIAGATSLALADSGLMPNTNYFYKVVATDTGAGNATSTSAQLSVITVAALNQNQFAQAPIVGMVDQKYAFNTKACQVDMAQTGSLLVGQAVKLVDSAGGLPKVVAVTANSDEVWGFINYSNKDQSFAAGAPLEVSQKGNVIYLVATGAIARGAQVTVDITYTGGVQSKNSGDKIVGFALDKATAQGQIIRVELSAPSYTLA